MAFQTVFKRYELKYMLTVRQKEMVLRAMHPHMALDQYGRSFIRNIYFDTGNYRLVRRSIESPAYKEKLRVRSYGAAQPDDTVFVELKKKYNTIVYKRRICLTEQDAMDWVLGKRDCSKNTQISQEIDYFMNYYGDLHPAVFLSYEREAYFYEENPDFRITFDDTILCRRQDLSLGSDAYGTELLPEGATLMEIKCGGGHSALDDACSLGRAYLQDVFFQIRLRLSAHDFPQSYEGGCPPCLTLCSGVFSTPTSPP